jgi:ABC-2 type transport system permease protein
VDWYYVSWEEDPMSLKRIGILLGKELWHGTRGFIFIWAIVLPIVLSLVLSLIFGTLFSEKPKLGVVDEDSSQLVTMLKESNSLVYREYKDDYEIRKTVESGSVDMGLVLPADFDNAVIRGDDIDITAYVWGESLAKDRTILGVTVTNLIRELSGQEAPVEIDSITLGNTENIPWNDRLLPLIILMAVFLGGIFLPATSVINEKEKKTLDALVITPTSIEDIFIAKGLFGIILSLFAGVLVLFLNQAFGAQPLLLVSLLALGATMAAAIGLICGALIKEITSLFAIFKSGGILLWAPAIIYLFPQIPQWIGRIFPTYYLLQPIIDISQRGGSWPDIALNVFILIGIDLVLISMVALTLKRAKQLAG